MVCLGLWCVWDYGVFGVMVCLGLWCVWGYGVFGVMVSLELWQGVNNHDEPIAFGPIKRLGSPPPDRYLRTCSRIYTRSQTNNIHRVDLHVRLQDSHNLTHTYPHIRNARKALPVEILLCLHLFPSGNEVRSLQRQTRRHQKLPRLDRKSSFQISSRGLLDRKS
jgi:hypothetical protein